jgi:hypothetical protein
MRASITLCEPIGDTRSKQSLRFAQSLRGRGRDDVILLRIDIQDRTGDFSKFGNTAAKLEAAFDSFL